MKVKIPVPGTVGRSVNFDPDAGPRAEAAVKALAAQISAGLGGSIRHSSLQGLQIGDDHPQYTGNAFPETITGQWNFSTIPFIQGETLAEYIEDVVGGSFFDFLQDTTSVVWTYFDTAQQLEANVPPEFVQDTVGAMLMDSTSIDFTYNDPAGTFTASTINANPTASVGLTAVNGTAATPMRSDGAPALDVGISPTWTGEHIFGNAKTVFTAATYIANSPNITLAQLDELGTAPISTISEHSFRAIRQGSPYFTGIAWGSALPGNPAAATSGTVLIALRGDGYDSTVATAADHNVGAWIQGVATESWTGTARGSKWIVAAVPIGSTTITDILSMYADTDSHIANSSSGALRMESTKFIVSPGNTAGYLANISSLPQSSMDQIFSGTGNFYTERLMRVIRAGAAVFDGLSYGAALTASAPAAVVNGTTLVQFRGAGYFGTGFQDFSAGSVFETVTTETWSSTARGCYADIQITANGSTALVEVARFDNSTTATHTRFMLYDVDTGALQRVTVGAANSGGAGFKLLRIPN